MSIRTVKFETIVDRVAEMCLTAAYDLPEEISNAMRIAIEKEESPLARSIMKQYLENAEIAARKRVPLCQDTGVAVYFIKLGTDVHIEGGMLQDSITEGNARGSKDGYLRNSIVEEPLFGRKNTGTNGPPIIHVEFVSGDQIDIVLAPKGGGSENMSTMAMLKTSAGKEGVVDFIVNHIVNSGGNPCPPTVVGIGLGGNFEKVCYLAKKALIRPLGEASANPDYAALEQEILEKLNNSGVGPQGLGGSTTAFAVHVEYMPCHIAALPVAINLNCHAARHAHVCI